MTQRNRFKCHCAPPALVSRTPFIGLTDNLRRGILIVAVCCCMSCAKEPHVDQSPSARNVAAKLMDSLDTRRTWPSDGVKIWLTNPTVVVNYEKINGTKIVIHAWPENQNDFNVPMARIDSGETLYAISQDEYDGLLRIEREQRQ